jgi:hypothetical protein
MSDCNIMPIKTKACSGKCKSSLCGAVPKTWVVAACEGMISLFEKTPQGSFSPKLQDNQIVFSSLDAFQKSMDKAENAHAFDQLVIIGSSNDIAWIHASLPAPAMRHIVAEIEYPLLPAWFKQPLPLVNLTYALEGIFAA